MVKPIRFPTYSLTILTQFFLALFLWGISSCQTSKPTVTRLENNLQKAKLAFSEGNYTGAEQLVLRVMNTNPRSIDALLLLSDISDELSKREQQKMALEKIITIDSVNYPLAFKLLGGLCFSVGDYENAHKYYQHYKSFNTINDSSFVSGRILSSIFAVSSIAKDRKVPIFSPGETINTPRQEYWPSIATNDSVLYFTRLVINENNFPFERIFESVRGEDGWTEAKQFMVNGDENVNVGTMCISANGQLLFFTVCGQNEGYGSCDIYYSNKTNNSWSKPLNGGSVLNGSSWDAQPSVSSDNHYIYFASNRPGGCGGMDIWRCEINEMKNGMLFFSHPENLGKKINTKGDDFSPYIHADGSTLYYSSEGKYGLGGSDIFITRLNDSVWCESENLGFPINTRFNDDGLIVSPTSNIAFFSSNRDGTVEGSKDLFQLELPDEYLPGKVGYITGKVYDSESGKSIEAAIEITAIETGKSKTVSVDAANGYITTLNAGWLYAFNIEKQGYLFYSRHFNLKDVSGFSQAQRVDINLQPVKVGQRFILHNVFFDFDSDVLKPESESELQRLTQFLRNNPQIKVEISGHTDNVGKEAYNMALSVNRATSIYKYLIQFIHSERLTFKGYGPLCPISTNETDDGRAQNRRCEIKILAE